MRPVPKEQDWYTPRQVGAGIQVVRVEEGEVRV